LPSINSLFNRDYSTRQCTENLSAGSCFLVAPLENCGEEPFVYTIEPVAAIAANATTAAFRLVSVTQDGVAVTPVPANVRIRANSILRFGTTDITVLDETTIVSAVGGTPGVAILPAPAAVAATTTTTTWALQLLEAATDIPLDITSSEESNKKLKDGLQSSSAKTSVSLSVNLSYFSDPKDLVQDSIMYPAALSSENFFAFIVKSSGKVAWGRFKVLSLSESGALDEIIKYSASLSFQAPWSIAARNSSLEVNTANQLQQLNAALSLSGLPRVV
jgi:hypothetical protein